MVAGCSSTPPPVTGAITPAIDPNAGQDSFAAGIQSDFALNPTDVVSITVFREPDLSVANQPISTDGTIGLPLLGRVAAAGMTPGELAAQIMRAHADRGYLRNPEVSVVVNEYASHRVTVEGAVKTPGVYKFSPGERLSAAIALAAGPNQVAKLRQVAVFRPSGEGMTAAKFDYKMIQEGTMLDPVLMPGDRVVVGTSGLSQAWRDALTAIPVFALFTRL